MEAIEIPKKMLTFAGHWPKISPSIFQRILYYLDLLFILSLLVEFSNHLDDYQGLCEHLAVAVSPISYIIKLIIFKFKSDAAQELINVLDLKEFNDYPKHLGRILEQSGKFSKYLGIAYHLLCFTTISLYISLPIFTQRDLPLMFSYDIGGFKPAMYAFQIMGMVSASTNNSCLDVLAMSLMGICAAQIEILNRKIIGLSDWSENEGKTLHNVNAELCKCAKHHVAIIRYHALLEKVFSMILLAQYATSAVVICNIGFQLAHVEPGSFQFINMIFYFNAMMIQLAMYCWFGNEIIVKSLAIRDACYEFKWYESDIKTRKTLIIIMERSKRPLFLTAGKLSILSLQSYTSVMRTSYSYFAVMQTLYGKNQN